MHNLKKHNKLKIYFILLIFLSIHFGLKGRYLNIKKYTKIQKEINNIEKYYLLCNNGILLNKKKFKKVNNPKISLISPVLNKEKYLLRLLRSIQNQIFTDIEIIFIDDCSTDNTLKLIKKFQKEDERILLIKHDYNKGTLISKNEGVIMSKGEYLIFVDPDDMLSNGILKYAYNTIKKNNYDIIRYNIYKGNNYLINPYIINKFKKKTIYQPELSLFIFYALGKINQNDFFLTNKIIKREIFIHALKAINEYYLKQNMIYLEDGLINFMLYRVCKSFYFIHKIGYYYILSKKSITIKSKNNVIKIIKNIFLYYKYIFQYTKNNQKEKKIAEYIIIKTFKYYKYYILDYFKKLNKSKKIFYKEILVLYLNCKFISQKVKLIFNKIKYLLYIN